MDLIKNKSKAQVSLEHILLIGGSVLLAITILAVVVNMGSNSRKNATTQGDNITYTTGGPMAPSILSVQAKYMDCADIKSHASLTFSWDPVAVSGDYSLIITNSEHKPVGNLNYVIYSTDGNYLDSNHLNPFQTRDVFVTGIDIGNDDCGNSYYLSVAVKKGNQVQVSREYPFSWSDQGPKTVIIYRPTFNPPAGSYNIAQFPLSVKLELPEPAGKQIYYTTDGSTPTKNSTPYIYGSTLTVNKDETLKAITVQNDKLSAISSGTYTVSYYTVDTPTANPPAQINLENPVDVYLSTTTSGANIYYTTDNSTPDCSPTGTLFNGTPIHITDNTRIKAIACKTDYIASHVATFDYNYYVPLDPPVLNPDGNTYYSIQHVGISSNNPQAEIHYTTDGVTDPTTSSPIYTTPITVASNMTIKAKAFVGVHESATTTENYIIELPADKPVFSPAPGTFNNNISVGITTNTPQPYEIRYALDGSDPKPTSAQYTSPILITKNTTLKAIVYKTGYTPSPITSGNYVFKLNPPSFSKSAGAYSDPIDVQIDSVAGATIRYTTDGSNPTQTTGTIISNGGVVHITNTTTLKAIAYKTGWSSSTVASSNYTINDPAADPVFSPDGGDFINSTSVTISCSTPSSTIKYTIGASDVTPPTRNSGTNYTGEITLNSTKTIKAICYADGYSTSNVVAKTFNITYKADPVIFSKPSGTYNDNISVYLSTNTQSPYEIRYTTDGTNPTTSSTKYTNSPVLITKNTFLAAAVFKTGYTKSDNIVMNYKFKLNPPTFNPTGGNFSDSVSVTLSTVAGAKMRMTVDGSSPTQTHGILIDSSSASVTLTTTTNLRAIAYKDGWDSSVVRSDNYTINAPAADPVFSPDGGSFNNSGTVNISCSTPSSTIRYTTDGTTPSKTTGTIYSGGINITSTTTINAVCYADGYSTSNVVSRTFTVNYPPGDVYVSGGGSYCGSTTLTATGGSGGTIYYEGTTSNGTSTADPTTTKTVTQSGIYYFRARSSVGLWGNQGSATVTINNDSTAPTSISGTTSVCSGSSTTLTEIGGNLGTGASYKWYKGGCGYGGVIGTGSSIVVNPTSNTTYYVRAEGTCGNTSCASTTVNVIPSPTITVTNGSTCGSGTVTLSATTTDGTIEWYTTSTGGSPIASGNTYTTPVLTSTTTYYVGVSGGACATSTRQPATATINPLPGSINVSSTPYGDCGEGYTLTATGGSGGIIYYQGTNSNGTSTSYQTTSKVVTSTGTYYFRARSSAGCWGPSGSKSVTVTPPLLIYSKVFSGNTNGWTVSGGGVSYSSGCVISSPWWNTINIKLNGYDFSNVMILSTVLVGSDGKHELIKFNQTDSGYYQVYVANNWGGNDSGYLAYGSSRLGNYPTITAGAGTKINIKVLAIGGIKKVKVWKVGTSEPADWGVSVTNSSSTHGTLGGSWYGEGGICSYHVYQCS